MHFWEHTYPINDLVFTYDDKMLVTGGSKDGVVCVFDVTTGKRLQTIRSNKDKKVASVAVSPDGLLAIAFSYEEVRVYGPSK